jgi:hypothetical protein
MIYRHFPERTNLTSDEILRGSYGDRDELASFMERTWMEVAANLRCVHAADLSLLNSSAFVYFLPGVLAGLLREPYGDVGDVQDALVSNLNPRAYGFGERAKEIFDLLTPVQRQTVAEFLDVASERIRQYPLSQPVSVEQMSFWRGDGRRSSDQSFGLS